MNTSTSWILPLIMFAAGFLLNCRVSAMGGTRFIAQNYGNASELDSPKMILTESLNPSGREFMVWISECTHPSMNAIGVLIKPLWVITVAGVVDSIQASTECVCARVYGTSHNVAKSRSKKHPKYQEGSFKNNIALLKLCTAAPFNHVVPHALLPSTWDTYPTGKAIDYIQYANRGELRQAVSKIDDFAMCEGHSDWDRRKQICIEDVYEIEDYEEDVKFGTLATNEASGELIGFLVQRETAEGYQVVLLLRHYLSWVQFNTY